MNVHSCPGPGCDQLVKRTMLACPAHWAQVPGHVKHQVYESWDHGAGAGSGEHAEAMREAISHMRALS